MQCILFSVVFTLPPPQPPRQCLCPTCHLSTLNWHYIPGAKLPYPYDGRAFVGPKKKTIVGLLIQSWFNPLCIEYCTLSEKYKLVFLDCIRQCTLYNYRRKFPKVRWILCPEPNGRIYQLFCWSRIEPTGTGQWTLNSCLSCSCFLAVRNCRNW